MVFSSHIFLFYFLPAALLLYYAAPRAGRHLVLTLLSYGFYGWCNPAFMVLMFASTAVDYVCGLTMSGQLRRGAWGRPVELLERGRPRGRAQTAALVISICSNLSLLGFFKYFNLAVSGYNDVVAALGLEAAVWDTALRITLPLGISFYTFQSMSYSIDVYRGDARAIRNPIDFACYVAMFPQLVAGPIIRFSEIESQLRHRTHTLEKFVRGAAFISLGLAKKTLLANTCGKIADMTFNAGSVGLAESWYGAAAYAFQIYFDFSGYSDMAIGLGLMLGFVFAKNFDSPYISASITEFWRRWHISLSTWLRDYLYVPLGGNRKGSRRTYVNLAVVMLLGGLWHGAAWNFIIWGGLHGVMLAAERMRGKRSAYSRLPRPARVALTFILLLITWVFFRTDSVGAALRYIGSMFGLGSSGAGAELIGAVIYQPYYVLGLAAAAIVAWTCPQTWDFTRKITWPKAVVLLALLWISIVMLTTQAFNPFIYFIF